METAINSFLQSQAKAVPKFATSFENFRKFYDQKLWHELTVELEKVSSQPDFAPYLNTVYENLVKDFQSKMNKISLIKFLSLCAKQKSPTDAISFLEPFRTDFLKNDEGAQILLDTEYAGYLLLTGNLENCISLLLKCEKALEKLPLNDPIINANFYKVSAEYYKQAKSYEKYYHNALLYLSSTGLENLTKAEQQQRAFDLCMSALLATNLYNFGELLLHPILSALDQTPFQWLKSLLLFYNSGDLNGFDKLSKTGEFLGQALLVASLAFLREKLCLMTLIEIVFRKSKEDRGRMSFAAIAKDTNVPLDEVEYLVMKALSLGLIKGSIDEVSATVKITWVQPRVLSKTQIQHIADRIVEWNARVEGQVNNLHSEEAFCTVFAQ